MVSKKIVLFCFSLVLFFSLVNLYWTVERNALFEGKRWKRVPALNNRNRQCVQSQVREKRCRYNAHYPTYPAVHFPVKYGYFIREVKSNQRINFAACFMNPLLFPICYYCCLLHISICDKIWANQFSNCAEEVAWNSLFLIRSLYGYLGIKSYF